MTELRSTQTYQNLVDVFSREATWLLRLAYFAQRAAYEGHSELGGLLDEVREGSQVAAEGHLDFLREVSLDGGPPATEATFQLDAALSHEREDVEVLYPRLVHIARSEGFPDIASWFESLVQTKRVYLQRLTQATSNSDLRSHPRG